MLELHQDGTVFYMTISLAETLKAIQFYKKEKERQRLKAARAYERIKEKRESQKSVIKEEESDV